MALLANLALANLGLAAPARAQSAGAVQSGAPGPGVRRRKKRRWTCGHGLCGLGRRSHADFHAGSNVLALQIERGAPADLFISADRAWMDYLANADLWRTTARSTCWPTGSCRSRGPGRRPPRRLAARLRHRPSARHGTLGGCDVDWVPAGRYARTALENLGLWPALRDRVARAENVRGALAFVARGETPLGIVYATDAAAEKRVVAVAALPVLSYPPVVYPMAPLRGSTNATARAFFDYLGSAPAPAPMDFPNPTRPRELYRRRHHRDR